MATSKIRRRANAGEERGAGWAPAPRVALLGVALGTAAFGIIALGVACNGPARTPTSQCEHQPLAAGAVMTYSSGGGIAGRVVNVTAFSDGRLEGSHLWQGPPLHARVPATRVAKLTADLAASGVLTEKDGCWRPPSPVPDGTGASIVFRDPNGVVHAYETATGATAPSSVRYALDIAATFENEVSPALREDEAGAVPIP